MAFWPALCPWVCERGREKVFPTRDSICAMLRGGETQINRLTENQTVPEMYFKREIHIMHAGFEEAVWIKKHIPQNKLKKGLRMKRISIKLLE